MNFRMIVMACCLLFAPGMVSATPLLVGDIVSEPGSRTMGHLVIPAGVDEGANIPISIIQGAEPGPTLALIAGTHGYEYAPILALQQVAAQLDAGAMKGSVIIVHVANVPSFLGRTIYYSPIDGMNLNRAYPGKPDGSVSERIAHAITSQVIEQADYVVDMHSGDGNEALRPYIYMPKTGQAELDATIKGMALAFGLDHIIIDERPVSAPEASTFTDMTALSRGIPAMTTEVGRLGLTPDELVQKNIDGAMNLMRHLGILDGPAERAGEVVWLGDYTVVTSPETGTFKPAVQDGYAVAEGGTLGHLTDLFGRPIATIKAPFSGVVNYVIATPPVSKGEPLAMISKLAAD